MRASLLGLSLSFSKPHDEPIRNCCIAVHQCMSLTARVYFVQNGGPPAPPTASPAVAAPSPREKLKLELLPRRREPEAVKTLDDLFRKTKVRPSPAFIGESCQLDRQLVRCWGGSIG